MARDNNEYISLKIIWFSKSNNWIYYCQYYLYYEMLSNEQWNQ